MEGLPQNSNKCTFFKIVSHIHWPKYYKGICTLKCHILCGLYLYCFTHVGTLLLSSFGIPFQELIKRDQQLSTECERVAQITLVLCINWVNVVPLA